MNSNGPIQAGLQAANYLGVNASVTGAKTGADAGTKATAKADANIGAILNGSEAGAKAGVDAANKDIKLNDEKGSIKNSNGPVQAGLQAVNKDIKPNGEKDSQGFCVDEHSTKGGVVHTLLGPLYTIGCKIFSSN